MPDQINQIPPHFVVVVPGYGGSRLRDKKTGEIVWVDFTSIPKNPLQWGNWLDSVLGRMIYPNDDLEPAGILDEVIFIPPWAKQEHYGRLIKALEDVGYESETNLYTFAYDWRQDNRISARQLSDAIDHWRVSHPGAEAWIIAHSNGGIVARWYIEKEGGQEHVGRLFLMGSPWDGTPRAMQILVDGLEILFRRGFNPFNIRQRTRDLFRTFPSIYQLLPNQNPFLRDLNNETVDPFSQLNWLDNDKERQLLLDGQQFNQDLGTTLSVETMCFFGRKKSTPTSGLVRFAAGDRWSGIDWMDTEAGDGTIPQRSAVHPNATQKFPFAVGHGDIYVTPAVLEFLQWELIDKYHQPVRAALATEHLTVVFEPEQDIYSPDETIHLWATIHKLDQNLSPISGARVEVQMAWRQPLPGETAVISSPGLPKMRLWENEEIPGRYEGNIEAPKTEGYYSLHATIQVVGEPTIALEELIIIETLPELQ